ncbi:MAG TPA: M61 family peptidase [Gammaproteobacteria bacterium]|nr:M61 family peptidase [Gammaproteobacteria bacterium]
MSHEPRVIRYQLSLAQPAAHVFHVTCTVTQPAATGQRLRLPAWIPGSYMIRDFARNILHLEARDATGPVAVTKIDKSTWQCAPAQGPLTVEYQVYTWDLSVRAAHFDETHAYFNGTSLFLAVLEQEDTPCELTIVRPADAPMCDWRVATAMEPAPDTARHAFGTYVAANYDELIDHPFEIGALTLTEFEVAGVPHEIAIYGKHAADLDRLREDVGTICETHVTMFGELPAMSRYVFLIMAVGEGYGGLEHRSSCSLLCSREDLPQAGDRGQTEKYRNFLGLCSHEYFHTWNIKRIKPSAFMPYDLQVENYTRQLWAFEGITSYYDDLALLRAGLIDLDTWLELLGQTTTRVMRGYGRHRQSVAESSFDAWTRFYKQDENASNAIVSYYAKGTLIALALDQEIRRHTSDRASLDDLMRRLWQEYGKPGIGVPEGRIEELASEIAGTDLHAFFATCVHGCDDPPLATLLARLGVQTHTRPAAGSDDKGGKAVEAKRLPAVSLGAVLTTGKQGLTLQRVSANGAAQQAGLSAGDVLVAVDGLRAALDTLETRLLRCQPGTTLDIHYFRRDELYRTTLTLPAAPRDTWYFSCAEDADTVALECRRRWLQASAAD